MDDPSTSGFPTALGDFLFPAPAPRTVPGIIGWWERRRLAYNVAVGGSGLLSLGAVAVASPFLGGPPDYTEIWVPVLVFGVLANVCYLLGPAVEIAIHKLWGRSVLPAGPALYRMGLTFSVGLALLPALLVTVAVIVRVILILV